MKTKLYFITGAQGQGKTTFIKRLATLLMDAGYSCSGFYAEGYWKNDLRSGFDIVQIDGGNRELLCNTIAGDGDEPFRRFFFKQKGLNFGNKILENAVGLEQIVIIDEVGALELEGRGWANAIENLLKNPPAVMIWTIRENLTERISKKFSLIPDTLWHIKLITPEEVFTAISRSLTIVNKNMPQTNTLTS